MTAYGHICRSLGPGARELRREGDVDNPFRSRHLTNSGTIHEIHEMVPLDGESSALDPSPLYNGSISFHPPRIRKRRQRQS